MSRLVQGTVFIAVIAMMGISGPAPAQESSSAVAPGCHVSSVSSIDQAGGITAGCLVVMPPPPPRIARELIGDWEGTSQCSTGPEKINWNISQDGDGQIQVQEAYQASRGFKSTGHVFYDGRWSSPLLILASGTMTHYRIAVKSTGHDKLSGRYFYHMNCTTISLHKVS